MLGGLTGAIIGSGIHSPRWVNVPLDTLHFKEKTAIAPEIVQPQKKSTRKEKFKKNAVRRWRFSAALGGFGRGPTNDIEKAMIRDGFDETLSGSWFGGPVAYPLSHTDIAVHLQLNRYLNPRFELGLLYSRTGGNTSGYREPVIFLNLYYSTNLFTPLLIYKPYNFLHFGLGAGISLAKIEQKDGDEVIYRERKTQLNGIWQCSILFPTNTRFFIKLDAEYRWIPQATYGPFKESYRKISLTELKPLEAGFSHAFIGGRFGIRF